MKSPGSDPRYRSVKGDLKKLRDQFREWYATLSVTEIMGNRALIQEIEVLEQRLSALVS